MAPLWSYMLITYITESMNRMIWFHIIIKQDRCIFSISDVHYMNIWIIIKHRLVEYLTDTDIYLSHLLTCDISIVAHANKCPCFCAYNAFLFFYVKVDTLLLKMRWKTGGIQPPIIENQ